MPVSLRIGCANDRWWFEPDCLAYLFRSNQGISWPPLALSLLVMAPRLPARLIPRIRPNARQCECHECECRYAAML
jgi:hypothetical protein